jgi:hypothetical protein
MKSNATTPRQLLLELALNDNADTVASIEAARERPGSVCEVGEETYFYYLELLPPQLIDGGFFCFAEGSEPYTLFWRRQGRYFAKQLTPTETSRLAQLARIPLPGDW